ncbi:hypothetical protein TWF694_010571 [Orbilia ellipsospora]|uniref:Uncharacterized protein n=1 Tax=Orbilia ellipsospora TaxID=2528407 RepID=A0AAV9XD03_9PEZI
MDVDWREVSRVNIPGALPHTPSTPLTALSFDIHQDLIWTGNDFVGDTDPIPSAASSSSADIMLYHRRAAY